MRNASLKMIMRLTAACLVCMTLALPALGEGFRNPPDGAANLGRGAVRLTRGEDPSTIAHNPANLMDLKTPMVTPSATIGYTEVEYTSPAGVSETTEDPWRVLPSVFASKPCGDGRYVLGVGVNLPYGQATKWDANGVFRVTAPYEAQMFTLNTTPAAAMQLTAGLSVGVGINIMYSDLELKQNLPSAPFPAGLMAPASPMTFEGDGWGIGAKAGLSWDVTDRQRLAVAYQAPVSIEYEGDFAVDNPLVPVPAANSSFETEIEFPSVVSLGYGVQVTDRFRVEANVEWAEHSRNSAINLDIGVNNPVMRQALGGTTSVPQDWDDEVLVGLGGDYRLSDHCVVRAGWTWLPTPVPERTLMTTLPESDVNFLGLGLGLHKGSDKLDLAWTYSIAEDVTVTENINPAVNGTYEFTSTLLAVSYTRAF